MISSYPRFFEDGKRRFVLSICGLCLLAFFTVSSYAQTSGSIVGTARDSSGEVVPGVPVVATNAATGISIKTVTNATGDYIFPSLLPGRYNLTFTPKSFRELKIENVIVNVASTIREDATLQIKTAVSRVEVRASSQLLHTETSDIATLVTSSQMTQLPLNGRDVYDLLKLTPGTESEGSSSRPTVAGGRAGLTRFRVDGIDVDANNTVQADVEPSVDAVQEFKMETTMAPASASGTSSVFVATKSGTNAFHGTLFDFLRNNVLDAHPYFEHQLTAPGFTFSKAQLRYNQFGGTIGGPIKKDHAFFFFSYEGLRRHDLNQVTGLYPTQDMLNGNFQGIDPSSGAKMKLFGPIYDPTTLAPFPNNIIPTDRFSPVSKALNAYIPAANCLQCLADGLGFDLIANAPTYDRWNHENFRIDEQIRSTDSIYFEGDLVVGNSVSNAAPVPVSEKINNSGDFLYDLHWTHIFSPNLLNQASFGYTRFTGGNIQNADANGQFTFLNTPFTKPDLFPTMSVTGYSAFGSPTAGEAIRGVEDGYDTVDNLTWIKGNHTFKTGFEFRRDHLSQYNWANGFFMFSNNLPPFFGFTMNAFSDYLLGIPSAGVTFQGTGKANTVERGVAYTYIEDNWQVNPRLTLNYGIRYEYPQQWHDSNTKLNRLGTLDLSPASMAMGGRFLLAGSPDYYIPGQGVTTGTGAPLIRSSLLDPNWQDFAPRFGFAYRPFKSASTVVRGGYGIFYSIPDAASVIFETGTPPFYYFDGVVNLPPQEPLGQPLHLNQFFPLGGPAGSGAVGSVPHNRAPRLYEWTFSVDHQIGKGLVLSTSYIGNAGHKLPLTQFINEPSLPDAQELALLEANPAYNSVLGQERAPFTAIPLNFQLDNNVAQSWYNAFNVQLIGRFGHGLTFTSFYTWSKALDMGSAEQTSVPTTNSDIFLNKSYADFDHTQRFVSSWVYDLPFGTGSFASRNHWLDAFSRGWEISGIATFESGPPYSITMGQDTSFRGGSLPVYPDMTAAPVTENIRQTGGIYLSEQNFTAPPFGQLGTLARNAFHGPGIINTDLGLMRNFVVKERLNVQFRAELFNAFNHAQFAYGGGGLLQSIAPPAAGQTLPQLEYYDPSLFGRAGARATRVIQFALRLSF